jgi:hypothetical protein
VTLLVKLRWPISNPIGLSFTRGISSVTLASKHRMWNRLSTHFWVNQQSPCWVWALSNGETSNLQVGNAPLHVLGDARVGVVIERGSNMRRMREEDAHGTRDRDQNAIAMI